MSGLSERLEAFQPVFLTGDYSVTAVPGAGPDGDHPTPPSQTEDENPFCEALVHARRALGQVHRAYLTQLGLAFDDGTGDDDQRESDDQSVGGDSAITPLDERTPAARVAELYGGLWDRFAPDGTAPLLDGLAPRPPGLALYPPEVTSREDVLSHAGPPLLYDPIVSPITVVTRSEVAPGELEAVPYAEAFADQLRSAAVELKRAARAAERASPSLARYLRARADALVSNHFRDSEALALDMVESSPVVVAIGPVAAENFDALLGKFAFGGLAALRRKVAAPSPESPLSDLGTLVSRWQTVDALLPTTSSAMFQRAHGRLSVAEFDLVDAAGIGQTMPLMLGTTVPALPSLRERDGACCVLFANVVDAKYRHVVVPLARRVLHHDLVGVISGLAFKQWVALLQVGRVLGPVFVVARGGPGRFERESKASVEERLGPDLAPLMTTLKAELAAVLFTFLLAEADVAALTAAARVQAQEEQAQAAAARSAALAAAAAADAAAGQTADVAASGSDNVRTSESRDRHGESGESLGRRHRSRHRSGDNNNNNDDDDDDGGGGRSGDLRVSRSARRSRDVLSPHVAATRDRSRERSRERARDLDRSGGDGDADREADRETSGDDGAAADAVAAAADEVERGPETPSDRLICAMATNYVVWLFARMRAATPVERRAVLVQLAWLERHGALTFTGTSSKPSAVIGFEELFPAVRQLATIVMDMLIDGDADGAARLLDSGARLEAAFAESLAAEAAAKAAVAAAVKDLSVTRRGAAVAVGAPSGSGDNSNDGDGGDGGGLVAAAEAAVVAAKAAAKEARYRPGKVVTPGFGSLRLLLRGDLSEVPIDVEPMFMATPVGGGL